MIIPLVIGRLFISVPKTFTLIFYRSDLESLSSIALSPVVLKNGNLYTILELLTLAFTTNHASQLNLNQYVLYFYGAIASQLACSVPCNLFVTITLILAYKYS